jgi:phage-related protein
VAEREPILDVRFCRNRLGHEPVREWLKDLSKDERRVIGEGLKTVQFGWPLGMPLVRKMQAGLWEVRVTLPSGIARDLFTTKGPLMILLHGFIKKSRKMPTEDLDLAVRRMKELHNG